jgi:hypothetical protein
MFKAGHKELKYTCTSSYNGVTFGQTHPKLKIS